MYCPITECSGKLCLHKRLFNPPVEAIFKVRNAGLCAKCTIIFLKITQIFFLVVWPRGFSILKRVHNQIKTLLEMSIVLASIVLTESNANVLTVSNNSETHLWSWKLWILVVGSKSSFYVTGARKDDKNRQNMLSLCWEKELGTEPTFVH